MVPSVRRPQVWAQPAVIAVNRPSGEVSCLAQLRPQHLAVPSIRRPQVWAQPAVMAVNRPAGAVACP